MKRKFNNDIAKQRLLNESKFRKDLNLLIYVSSLEKNGIGYYSCVACNSDYEKMFGTVALKETTYDIEVLGCLQAIIDGVSYAIKEGYTSVEVHYNELKLKDIRAYLSSNCKYANYYIKFLHNVKEFINIVYYYDTSDTSEFIICKELLEMRC